MAEEKEKDEIVHIYGDIREMDRELPRWWLYTLYGSILFAFGYWFHYEVFRGGDNPSQTYAKEVAIARAREAEKVRAAGVLDDVSLVTLSRDPSTTGRGKEVFVQTCAACHGPEGAGNIGPNLTDAHWIHGGAPTRIFSTIRDGVADKGMPAWAPQLGIERVEAVTAYVLSIRGTNVPGGKPPQGEKEQL